MKRVKSAKKTRLLWAVCAAALVFASCPSDEGDGGTAEAKVCADPKLPKSGAYLGGSRIIMETKTGDAYIYYTLDGTDPTAESDRYRQSDIPVLVFEDAESVTVKAVAIAEGYEDSQIVQAVYTEYTLTASDTVKALLDSSPGTGSINDPKRVKIPAEMAQEELFLEYSDPDQMGMLTVRDGLGQLYQAVKDRYFELDFTETNWQITSDYGQVKGIPGCNSGRGTADRPDKDKLLNIKFPQDIVYIDQRAFEGSTKLRKVDLNGLSQLKAIGDFAFRFIYEAELIDFTGCGELEVIKKRSFTCPWKVPYIDFTPCVKLKTIEEYAFAEPRSAKWIEFPASIESIGDYQFRDAYSLEYVRFRAPANHYWGWCQFWYHDWQHTWSASGNPAFEYNGMKPTHLHEGVEGEYSYRTDHMFVIYHPNNLTYGRYAPGYYSDSIHGYFFLGQSVPESTPGPKGYINPNEEFRGLAEIRIDPAGLSGGDVTNNLDDRVIPLGQSFTFGTPAAGKLRVLDEETAQDFIIRYDPEDFPNRHFTTPDGDVYQMPMGEIEEPIVAQATLGKAWVTPKDVKFAVLELTSGGKKLVRYGEDSFTAWGEKSIFSREVIPVYVDKPAVITVSQKVDRLAMVSLSLKTGWNYIERIHTGSPNIRPGPETRRLIRISGLKLGTSDAEHPNPPGPVADTTTKDIPWVLRDKEQDDEG